MSLQLKSRPVKKINANFKQVKISRRSKRGHGAERKQDQGAIADDQSSTAGEGCGAFELSLTTAESPLSSVI